MMQVEIVEADRPWDDLKREINDKLQEIDARGDKFIDLRLTVTLDNPNHIIRMNGTGRTYTAIIMFEKNPEVKF